MSILIKRPLLTSYIMNTQTFDKEAFLTFAKEFKIDGISDSCLLNSKICYSMDYPELGKIWTLLEILYHSTSKNVVSNEFISFDTLDNSEILSDILNYFSEQVIMIFYGFECKFD